MDVAGSDSGVVNGVCSLPSPHPTIRALSGGSLMLCIVGLE